MKGKLLFSASLLICSMIQTTYAEQKGDTSTVDFQGTFSVLSPCTISSDKDITVSFGNVGVNKVDGINYEQSIPYTVDCKDAPDNTAVQVEVSGTAELYDNAALKSTVTGLGIQIKENGQPLTLNKPLDTTLDQMQSLSLTAVPVKDPAATLTAQQFSAIATLRVYYQ